MYQVVSARRKNAPIFQRILRSMLVSQEIEYEVDEDKKNLFGLDYHI